MEADASPRIAQPREDSLARALFNPKYEIEAREAERRMGRTSEALKSLERRVAATPHL